MKPLLTILFIASLHYSQAQTFVSFAGGTSTKRDAALHAAIGYQYKAVSIEAGMIGAPFNTDRPLFLTSFLSADLPLNDNFKVVPLAGISVKTWQPGKNKEVNTGAYIGARLQWTDYFIQASHTDETYFFSVGFKGYIKDKK